MVDDHQIVREGIANILKSLDNFDIVAEASNGAEAVKLVKINKPDIVMMDINMPVMDGVEASHQIRMFDDKVKILILTMMEDEQYVYDALSANINGYIYKMGGLDDLVKAINTISSGENYFDFRVTNILLNKSMQKESVASGLTKREIEIVKHISSGLTSREIGELLFISKFTVQKHRKNILKKLQIKGTAELIKFALTNRLE